MTENALLISRRVSDLDISFNLKTEKYIWIQHLKPFMENNKTWSGHASRKFWHAFCPQKITISAEIMYHNWQNAILHLYCELYTWMNTKNNAAQPWASSPNYVSLYSKTR